MADSVVIPIDSATRLEQALTDALELLQHIEPVVESEAPPFDWRLECPELA